MPHQQLGTDTFRGISTDSSSTRAALYAKVEGQHVTHPGATGLLLHVASPVSGSLLTVPDSCGAQHHAAVKDPVSGTLLHVGGSQAAVVTPVHRQAQVHSRRFYLTKDVDITIATLRATTRVSEQTTNEKLGTAGTSTGMDASLVLGSAPQSRRWQRRHEKQ